MSSSAIVTASYVLNNSNNILAAIVSVALVGIHALTSLKPMGIIVLTFGSLDLCTIINACQCFHSYVQINISRESKARRTPLPTTLQYQWLYRNIKTKNRDRGTEKQPKNVIV